jgi:hypothetical protein
MSAVRPTVGGVRQDHNLPDRWGTRDLPVLVAVARRLDAGERVVDADDEELLVELAPLDRDAIANALMALANAGYIDCGVNMMLSGDKFVAAHTLRERGRRAVGLWPNEEQAADALVGLLTQAAEHVDNEDDAGALKKAGRLLRGVPASVLADVTAALIRQQTGIG